MRWDDGNLLTAVALSADEKETSNDKTLQFHYRRRIACSGFGVCAIGDADRG
jgi:hypothetical protein